MGPLLLGLVLCITLGAIGVAIVRGVPAGSFLLGALIFLSGTLFAVLGFVGTVVFLAAIAARLLGY